ncbi:MAG: MFS transporter [Candidatus Aenigmarchaeota archaeon]|nr:MFS transporter [Candidatus Aenigmarchaeota archaeon]
MKFSISKEVKLLSLSFLLIFLGFNGVQQYITTFFSDIGAIDLGFQSLILIYLFFILFYPLSALFVSKYGAKRCMIISSVFYSIFILSLLSKSTVLIYFSSSLLGIAASLLWTGQNSYLIRASDKSCYGTNSGFFASFQSLGSALGVFILGVFISVFLFNASFIIFSIFPILGFLLLFGLRDLKAKQEINHFRLIKKSITSTTALKLSSLWFATTFVYGLVIGVIPLEIKNVLGISYIGVLSSLFYILPLFLSYYFGKLSDIKGRRIMIIFSYILLLIGLVFLSLSSKTIFLISGIVLLALNWAIIKPITYALVGDVTTEYNLEFLTALFWMVQSMGVLSALLLSQIFKLEIVTLYLISILIVICSLIILLPLLSIGTKKIREKISQEIK